MNTSPGAVADSSAFNGLLFVAAGINPNNRDQVQIHVLHHGQTWCIKSCDAQEARTWLGDDAERLVRWDPSSVEDDGLSGIYRKPSFQTPAWVVHWEEIKDLDGVVDREKMAVILGEPLGDEEANEEDTVSEDDTRHKQVVFVNDIGGHFLIRIGASDFFEYVTATQIWGPCDNEKVNHLAFANEKGSHLWHISTPPCSNGVAQTVPESFLPPTVQKFSPVLLPVQRLPPPATAFPTPGAGCSLNATPSQGRAGGSGVG